MAEACPLCRQRKGKRACPAKGASICSHCCGSKRRVEIACPEDCVYLAGAPSAAWAGRETERRRDAQRIGPHAQALTETQGQLLFLTLLGIQRIRAARKELDDRLLLQAVSALRKTVETRTRGVLYEHPADDVRAQAILLELAALVEARSEAGERKAPDDRDLLPVLAALEASLLGTLEENAGPGAFLDTVSRLVGRTTAGAAAGPRAPLIVTP